MHVGRHSFDRRSISIEFSLRALLLICATGFAIGYVIVALSRAVYPFDIDFVEDGILMQALRVAHGQPVFLPPNAEFVPHIYMPLYAWLAGLLLKIFEPGFAPLRLLSLSATLTTTLLIYIIAQRESKQRWIAIVCAGLFLAGYRFSGGWYELARADAMLVTLAMGGVACAIYAGRSTRGLILSGVLLGLSFLTKQNGLAFAILMAVYLLFARGRKAWIMLCVCALVSLTPILILQLSTDGWFSTYVFDLAYSANPLEWRRLIDTLRFEWFGAMIVLSMGWVVVSISAILRWRARFIIKQPWLIFVAAALGVSASARTSVGGNLNNIILGYAFLCLMPALLYRWIEEFASTRMIGAKRLLSIALLIQFALCLYNPLRYIPDEAMYRSSEHLIERIASIDGEVLVMLHPFYAVKAGKAPSAQTIAMWHARRRGTDPLPQDFVDRIESDYYAAIVSDESLFEIEPALLELIEAHYTYAEELGPTGASSTLDGQVPRPVIYIARH